MYKVIQEMVINILFYLEKIERVLGKILLIAGCCVNIFCIFMWMLEYKFLLFGSINIFLKIISGIWFVAFFVYIVLIILLKVGNSFKRIYLLRMGVAASIVIQIFYHQWLFKEYIVGLFGIFSLILIIAIDVLVNNMKKRTSKNIESVSFRKSYRDDRQYLPSILKGIKNPILRERIENEVGTYVYGAYKYKRRVYIFSTLSISLPAIVVTLNSIEAIEGTAVNITVSFLSMGTVIVTGIMSTMKARESWVRNREYAERAKNEIVSCLLGINEYSIYSKTMSEDIIEKRENILAQRLENLYMEERGQWRRLRASSGEEKNGSAM